MLWCRWWTMHRAAIAGTGPGPAHNLALQLGFIVPPVHITDNPRLEAARVCHLHARV